MLPFRCAETISNPFTWRQFVTWGIFSSITFGYVVTPWFFFYLIRFFEKRFVRILASFFFVVFFIGSCVSFNYLFWSDPGSVPDWWKKRARKIVERVAESGKYQLNPNLNPQAYSVSSPEKYAPTYSDYSLNLNFSPMSLNTRFYNNLISQNKAHVFPSLSRFSLDHSINHSVSSYPYPRTLTQPSFSSTHVPLPMPALSNLHSPGMMLMDGEEEADQLWLERYFRLGEITYCNKCNIHRPARCHHCKWCNKCQMRMDHHCPFVGQCIGLRTQKFFVLGMLYTVLAAVIYNILDMIYIWQYLLPTVRRNIFLFNMYFNSYLFSWGLIVPFTYFIVVQVRGVMVNITTMENNLGLFDPHAPNRHRTLSNLKEFFGPDIVQWFNPFARPKISKNDSYER